MKFDSKLPIKERIRKRRRKKKIKLVSIVMVLAILVSIRWWNFTYFHEVIQSAFSETDAKDVSNTNDRKTNNLQPISSIEETEDKEASEVFSNSSDNTLKTKQEIEEYLNNFTGVYGVYFINLKNGSEFGINDTSEYVAASTVKVPLNLYLYKKIANGSVNPNQVLTYTKNDYEEGTGSLQYKKVGTTYQIKELSRLSIELSDNVATNILLRFLGRQNLKNYMRSLGGTVVDDKKNISCPKDMALYMKKVYEFCEDNKEEAKDLMHSLENTVFNDRIPALLPQNVVVAHKIGTQVGTINDVGIVYADTPYVIAVMSKNISNEKQAADVIANISKIVYQHS